MRRVLVVEDDPEVAESIVALLEDYLGARVKWARTSDEAIGMLGLGQPPAAILIDYWLQSGWGTQVALAAARRTIPFAIITGDPAVADQLERRGVPVLQKPFGMAELTRLLERLLLAPPAMEPLLHALQSELQPALPGAPAPMRRTAFR